MLKHINLDSRRFMDKASIRFFDLEKDYAMVSSWWKAHGSALMKPEHLPRTGIITEVEKQPVASGFLYHTDSKICVFEYIVVNPRANKAARNCALDALLEAVIYWAKHHGYTLIYNSTSVERFIKRLGDKGFMALNKNQTHMFCEVL